MCWNFDTRFHYNTFKRNMLRSKQVIYKTKCHVAQQLIVTVKSVRCVITLIEVHTGRGRARQAEKAGNKMLTGHSSWQLLKWGSGVAMNFQIHRTS